MFGLVSHYELNVILEISWACYVATHHNLGSFLVASRIYMPESVWKMVESEDLSVVNSQCLLKNPALKNRTFDLGIQTVTINHWDRQSGTHWVCERTLSEKNLDTYILWSRKFWVVVESIMAYLSHMAPALSALCNGMCLLVPNCPTAAYPL